MEERLALPSGLDGLVCTYQWVGHRYPTHHHAELEVNLVLQGTATYVMGERRYSLGPGIAHMCDTVRDTVANPASRGCVP